MVDSEDGTSEFAEYSKGLNNQYFAAHNQAINEIAESKRLRGQAEADIDQVRFVSPAFQLLGLMIAPN